MRSRVLALILAFILPMLPACGTQRPGEATPTLVVTVVTSLAGDFAPLGTAVHNGVRLAVEEWNQRGGILGRPVQAKLYHSDCDYTTARQVAQKAIAEDGGRFIINAVCSDAAEGVAQVASRLEAVQISPTVVAPLFTQDVDGKVRPLVFRVPFIDPLQGKAAAQFALQTLRADSVAILYAENSAYGSDLADAFAEAFKEGGGEVAIRATYDQDADTYYDVLGPVRDAAPAILYLPGYYDVMNRLVVQARAFGLLQTIIGSDGWDSPDLNLAGVAGSYFTTYYFPEEPRPEVAAWIQRYTARYLAPPDVVATLSYDATNILLRAIQEAGTATDPYQVAEAMEKLTFDAVSGQITFDEFHNPLTGVLLVQVRNGQVVYVDRLNP